MHHHVPARPSHFSAYNIEKLGVAWLARLELAVVNHITMCMVSHVCSQVAHQLPVKMFRFVRGEKYEFRGLEI